MRFSEHGKTNTHVVPLKYFNREITTELAILLVKFHRIFKLVCCTLYVLAKAQKLYHALCNFIYYLAILSNNIIKHPKLFFGLLSQVCVEKNETSCRHILYNMLFSNYLIWNLRVGRILEIGNGIFFQLRTHIVHR